MKNLEGLNKKKVAKAALWALAGTMFGTVLAGYMVNGASASVDMLNVLFYSVATTASAVALAVVIRKDRFFNK